MLGGEPSFVSRPCCGAVFVPPYRVLADPDEWDSITLYDGGAATARVIGPVGGYRADSLALRDLNEQVSGPGLSPSRLGLNSTAQMFDVAVSMGRCT